MYKNKLFHMTFYLALVTRHLSLVTCHMYTLKYTTKITRSPERIHILMYECKFFVVRLSAALLVEVEYMVPWWIYCIPRYRDYPTAKIDLGA